jgi:hypothetical protein
VNRKAGKKFPANPTRVKRRRFRHDLSLFKALIANGSKANAAINIRSAATCVSEKIAFPSEVNIPSFMRIKELPQMQARRISKNQLLYVFITAQNYIIYWMFNAVLKIVEN